MHGFEPIISNEEKEAKLEPSQCNDLYFLKWFGILHHKAVVASKKSCHHKVDTKKVSIPKAQKNEGKNQMKGEISLNAVQISRSEPPPRSNSPKNVDLDTESKKYKSPK